MISGTSYALLLGMKDKRILIVDDEPGFRFSVHLILKSQGYEVLEAEGGIPALDIVHQARRNGSKIDLVITDIKMPGMDGLDFIRELSSEQVRSEIMVMTGYGDRQTLAALDELGCRKIIHKPFNAQDFLEMVRSFFQSNQA